MFVFAAACQAALLLFFPIVIFRRFLLFGFRLGDSGHYKPQMFLGLI